MSTLTRPNRKTVIFRQIARNLASRPGIVGSLLAVQLAGIVIALTSSGVSDYNSYGGMNINTQFFNTDVIFVLTLAWAFLAPLYLTGRDSFEADMIFATDRMSRHAGNIAYMALLVLAGSLTAVLASTACLLFPVLGGTPVIPLRLGDWGLAGYALVLLTVLLSYSLLAAGAGYLLGTLLGLSRLLVIVFFLLALIVLGIMDNAGLLLLGDVGRFLFGNDQPGILLIKAVAVSAALFAAAALISNRQEAGA